GLRQFEKPGNVSLEQRAGALRQSDKPAADARVAERDGEAALGRVAAGASAGGRDLCHRARDEPGVCAGWGLVSESSVAEGEPSRWAAAGWSSSEGNGP